MNLCNKLNKSQIEMKFTTGISEDWLCLTDVSDPQIF